MPRPAAEEGVEDARPVGGGDAGAGIGDRHLHPAALAAPGFDDHAAFADAGFAHRIHRVVDQHLDQGAQLPGAAADHRQNRRRQPGQRHPLGEQAVDAEVHHLAHQFVEIQGQDRLRRASRQAVAQVRDGLRPRPPHVGHRRRQRRIDTAAALHHRHRRIQHVQGALQLIDRALQHLAHPLRLLDFGGQRPDRRGLGLLEGAHPRGDVQTDQQQGAPRSGFVEAVHLGAGDVDPQGGTGEPAGAEAAPDIDSHLRRVGFAPFQQKPRGVAVGHRLQELPRRFLAAHVGHQHLVGVVVDQHLAVLVQQRHHHRGDIDDVLDQRLLGGDVTLQSHLRRDVALNAEKTAGRAVLAPDRHHLQFRQIRRAVLAAVQEPPVPHPAAGDGAPHVLVDAGRRLMVGEQTVVASGHLRRHIAGQALERRIDVQDAPLGVRHRNPRVHRFHRLAEQGRG